MTIFNANSAPKKCIEKKLLWTNASPASAFAAQTVVLDLSEYDGVEIVYKINANRYDTKSSIHYKTDEAGILTGSFVDAAMFADRRINVLPTYVYFGPAWSLYAKSMSNAQENTTIIPKRIYGVKGVQ